MVLAAFFLLRITEHGKIKSDAAIAMISAAALAIGIIVTSMTTGMTTDVSSYMFGSILAMSKTDVRLSVVLSIVVLGLFLICYNKIFAVTFDENFARATGVNVSWYNVLIAILTAITIVLGMRMMGAMLISSLIIFPALTSMRIFKSFRGVVLSSGVLGVVCFCIGMVIEPYSHREDPATGRWRATYATFRCLSGDWYEGICCLLYTSCARWILSRSL